mmetsp:Transcript_38893/g.85485  ORF Transcript_38893/g.85485 Transcript_38893/m.85485 type:complete len:242 (-) Transcript_38893:869-1594(-)
MLTCARPSHPALRRTMDTWCSTWTPSVTSTCSTTCAGSRSASPPSPTCWSRPLRRACQPSSPGARATPLSSPPVAQSSSSPMRCWCPTWTSTWLLSSRPWCRTRSRSALANTWTWSSTSTTSPYPSTQATAYVSGHSTQRSSSTSATSTMASLRMSSPAARLLEGPRASSLWRTQHGCGVRACPVCPQSACATCPMSLQMHLPRSHTLSRTTWPMTPHLQPMHRASMHHHANASPRSVAGS